MANVGERCEISRRAPAGALYWAAGEPSDPRARLYIGSCLLLSAGERSVQLKQMATD